jgi:hypothetical protein
MNDVKTQEIYIPDAAVQFFYLPEREFLREESR